MAKLSVISVVNDKDTYEFGLKESLGQQSYTDYEIIKVDNIGNKYDYLALAYEDGLERASGEWLCFIHPDMKFLNEDSLKKLVESVFAISEEHPEVKLFGAAGVTAGEDYHIISSMCHGIDKRSFAEDEELLRDGYKDVLTVDACCMLIKKSDMERFGFWNGGLGFHMVAEELSLHVVSEGYRAVVVPAELWHFSDGRSLDYTYFRELRHLIRKYKNIDYINTTSHSFKNNLWLPVHLRYRELRSFVWHKVLGR